MQELKYVYPLKKPEEQNNLVVEMLGLKGSAKTIMLLIFLYFAWRFQRKKVYTNFEVGFPHEKLDIQKLIDLDVSLQNSAIGITEMHMICDARKHGARQNLQMSYFVTQSRHRSVDLYYDTQFERQVDVRIRENTDINVICENLFLDTDNDGLNDMYRIIVIDKRNPYSVPFERTLYLRAWYQLYNTDVIINPFTMKLIKRKKEDRIQDKLEFAKAY